MSWVTVSVSPPGYEVCVGLPFSSNVNVVVPSPSVLAIGLPLCGGRLLAVSVVGEGNCSSLGVYDACLTVHLVVGVGGDATLVDGELQQKTFDMSASKLLGILLTNFPSLS